MGDVDEVLHVHLEAMQRGMGRLDGTQIGLATVLARAGADELGVAEDAVDRALADRQLEHIHQTTRTQAGSHPARGDDRPGHLFPGLAGLMLGPAGMVGERFVTCLPASQPQAHGVARAAVAAHRRTHAMGLGVANQFMTQGELVLAHAAHSAIESNVVGVGWSLNTSASHDATPGSRFCFSDEAPDGQAPSSLPVRGFICCLSHLIPRFPRTRSSIMTGFRSPGSGSLWVCLWAVGMVA